MLVQRWEPVAMEGEGDPEGQIGPVQLREGLRVQEKEIGATLLPVEDDGHENPVVFLDSSRTSDEEELARIVAVYGPHLVVQRVL